MAYRSDFYCADNLYGYTGKLEDFPTVYFLKPSTGEFGHITQKHDIQGNVGREAVRIADGGYRAVNELVNVEEEGKIVKRDCLVEYSGSRKLHTSRNKFMAKDPSSEGTLLQAIPKFTEEKSLSVWYDVGDGNARPGIELQSLGAPRDALGRRGAVSAGATIRIR
jgi:hypothetical protein